MKTRPRSSKRPKPPTAALSSAIAISQTSRVFVSLLQKLYATGLPPVRGAINAAMVLNDSVMETMTFEQWDRSVRTKINSSRNMHTHLPAMEFFHHAVNQLLDLLVIPRKPITPQGIPTRTHLRVTALLKACQQCAMIWAPWIRLASLQNSVTWATKSCAPSWTKWHLVPSMKHVVFRMVEAGIRDPLRKTLADCQIVLGPNLFAFSSGSAVAKERRFGTLRITSQRSLNNAGAAASGSALTAALIADLKAATTLADATKVILELFMPKLADMFSILQSDMDPNLPLSSYGVDSLISVELRNWISGTMQAKVSVFEILQTPSLMEFAALIAGKSEYVTIQDSETK